MKSAFGSKRKPRKIEVDEDDDIMNDAPTGADPTIQRMYHLISLKRKADTKKPADEANIESSAPKTTSAVRKPFRKSNLRQSIAFDDGTNDTTSKDDADDDGPAVVRASKVGTGKSGSITSKKKKTSSRLSFGPGEIISGDAAELLEDEEVFTPKKSGLGRRVIENNALRKSLPGVQNLSIRTGEDDEERPTYSKDYLNELKSSTPSTPKDLRVEMEDGISLDPSELEGAMIVDDVQEKFGSSLVRNGTSAIPTEAEIREKKERRARMAHEPDFISLNDDGRGHGEISLLPRKKKPETRLVREDEDLGEGFDEFVDDGRISLGKKAERAEKKKKRAEMANMIHEAEGSSSDDSNDSEAERIAAYEAAQTRAGMDGLKNKSGRTLGGVEAPPKIGPLPNLNECLEKLQRTMGEMEMSLKIEKKRMDGLKAEKDSILAREIEVQRLLKEAGDRYTAMRADTGAPPVDTDVLMQGSDAPTGPPEMAFNRGLESFGSTPTNSTQVNDVG